MFKLFLVVVLFVAVAVILLGVKIFFTSGGKFPNSHVGGNKALSEKGIHCVQTQDYIEYNAGRIENSNKHRK